MNLIADNLFSLLLGWTRSLLNSLWNIVTNNGSGMFGFLQRFWLPILIIFVLAGTFFDLIIWLIRWRPYYAWGTSLRKRAHRRHLSKTREYMEDLDHSPLDLPEYRQYNAENRHELMDEPVYFDFQQAPQNEPAFVPQAESPEPEYYPVYAEPEAEQPFVPNLPWQQNGAAPSLGADQNLFPGSQAAADVPVYQPQTQPSDAVYPGALYDSSYVVPGFQEQAGLSDDPSIVPDAPRRRRSETRRQRPNVLKSIKDTLFTPEEELYPGDDIFTPVNPDDAFHKPYYPQNYVYKEQPQQNPPQDPPKP